MNSRATHTRSGNRHILYVVFGALISVGACAGDGDDGVEGAVRLDASDASLAAVVDPRFQSFNVEMVEVTGGEFWVRYDENDEPTGRGTREPIDLADTRLRNLARELAPAFMRVSGSWANETFFDAEDSTQGEVPQGFSGVLTPEQWDAANEFAMTLGFEIITSFAGSGGTRDDSGDWTPDLARSWLEYTRDRGYPVTAVEFLNEPGYGLGGLPAGYTAEQYARDFAAFETMVNDTFPSLWIVGHSNIGEVTPQVIPPTILTQDMMSQIGSGAIDAFSYHYYPASSKRCGVDTKPQDLLSLDYLARVDDDAEHYEAIRDEFDPSIPMWISETGQATCGGDPFADEYVEALRYLDQLGRVALRGTAINMHNTLAASDYALIDEDGFVPRPSYWAAVHWQRLMGDRSLALAADGAPEDLRLYAHCTAGGPSGAVTYLAINLSEIETRTVRVRPSADLYLLTGKGLRAAEISLNGSLLTVAPDGTVGELTPQAAPAHVEIPTTSIAFIVDDAASAAACL